jgi:hypothetical protein
MRQRPVPQKSALETEQKMKMKTGKEDEKLVIKWGISNTSIRASNLSDEKHGSTRYRQGVRKT